MKALIVFESMFGNTEKLAAAVAEGLDARTAGGADIALLEVRRAGGHELSSYDLLVVAAPTHAFSLSRPQTRADAVTRGADPATAEIGVREWLDGIGTASTGPVVAVFDTRAEKARHLPGSAARRVSRTLRRQGFELIAPAVSFYVEDVKGPVSAGEAERAEQWGRDLAVAVRDASNTAIG